MTQILLKQNIAEVQLILELRLLRFFRGDAVSQDKFQQCLSAESSSDGWSNSSQSHLM